MFANKIGVPASVLLESIWKFQQIRLNNQQSTFTSFVIVCKSNYEITDLPPRPFDDHGWITSRRSMFKLATVSWFCPFVFICSLFSLSPWIGQQITHWLQELISEFDFEYWHWIDELYRIAETLNKLYKIARLFKG